MEISNRTSRDYALDPREPDGVRPVEADAGAATADATDTGPGADAVTGPPVNSGGAPEPAPQPAPAGTSPADRSPRLTRASAAWAALIAALLLSVVLIVFVMQNPTSVVLHFLGWSGSVAVGMAMLIAAVTGGLLVATVGVARLTQLRVRDHRRRATPRQ